MTFMTHDDTGMKGVCPFFSSLSQGLTLHDYDIIYGPIANDRVGAQIARYKQGYITFQYAFCTQRAIDKLMKVV